MTEAATRIPARGATLARLWAVSLATAAAFVAAAWWPAQRFGGDAGTAALVLATVVALMGSLAAAVAPAVVCRGTPRELAYAVLFGLGLRFFLTLGPALLIKVLALMPHRPVFVWLAIAQFVLLLADVAALIYVLRRAPARQESL